LKIPLDKLLALCYQWVVLGKDKARKASILIRLPADLKAAIEACARAADRTMNSFCLAALRTAVRAETKKTGRREA
jgi:hypothetical protein